jgi:hypothetical protein
MLINVLHDPLYFCSMSYNVSFWNSVWLIWVLSFILVYYLSDLLIISNNSFVDNSFLFLISFILSLIFVSFLPWIFHLVSFLFSFIHLFIAHTLFGPFLPPALHSLPVPPLPPSFQAEHFLPFFPILLKRRHKQ